MSINVVMYHYVRNNEDFSYDTFCRRKNEFEAQIEYFQKTSSITNPFDLERIKYYLESDIQSTYLLTFDDGYQDHLYCAEYLHSRDLSAYFFPTINSINGKLLDVNAIHMLVGKRGLEINKILEKLSIICLENNYLIDLKGEKVDINTYIEKFDLYENYDDKKTQILKKVLQRDLIGDKNRVDVIDILIKKFIGKSSKEIANEIYLDLDNLLFLKSIGMIFGSHGNTHRWLDKLNYNEQKSEIKESFKILKNIRLIQDNETKAMCYPFGGFNNETITIMDELNIDIGFTTKEAASKLGPKADSIFKLPRWDTNNCWDAKWRRPCSPC